MAHSTTPLDRRRIEQLVRDSLRQRTNGSANGTATAPLPTQTSRRYTPANHNGGPNPLVVNVSARHVHVTQQDLEILYGPGARLTKLKDLYQEGEFASEQTVNIIAPQSVASGSSRSRMIPGIRILGPTRKYTQVELAYTDGIFLGMKLPLRISGNHQGTPGCVIVGPHGALNLTQGVIRAERHVHMGAADLAHFGVRDGDKMKLRIEGPCGLTFDRVTVREHPKVILEIHIDTDEGNACDLASATRMELLK